MILALFPWKRRGLDYLLSRLFSGEEVAPGAIEHYNVTVRALGDKDEIITVPEPNEPAG